VCFRISKPNNSKGYRGRTIKNFHNKFQLRKFLALETSHFAETDSREKDVRKKSQTKKEKKGKKR